MLPTKEVENNYGYNGSYKEMNCLTAYGEYKSTLKDSEPSEDKPDAVKCAYDKYTYDSNDSEQDRMRKSAHKGIIADFCENSTTACNIEDESGNPVEPDKMCMDLNVCDQGMTLFEIVPLALEFFKIFQVLLKDIGPDEAAKLLSRKNSRVTEFKKKQAQLKLIEMDGIKKKYNDVIESEKTAYIKLYPETEADIAGTEASESESEQTNKNGLGGDTGGTDEENNSPKSNNVSAKPPGEAAEAAKTAAEATGEAAGDAAGDAVAAEAAAAEAVVAEGTKAPETVDAEGTKGTVANGGTLAGGADQEKVPETTDGIKQENGDHELEKGDDSKKVVCVPKKDSEEDREICAKHELGEDCNNDTKCMVESKNPILDEDWKKYNFETALAAYKEYILFKKVCSKTDVITKIIKDYEDKMTMDLAKKKEEREPYKDTNQLFAILEEYEKQSAQSKELQTSGTFSKLTKGVKNLSDKALETDNARKKCANIALTGHVGEMVEGAVNLVTAPVTGIAKIAETKNNNAVEAKEGTEPKAKVEAKKEAEPKVEAKKEAEPQAGAEPKAEEVKQAKGGGKTQKKKKYKLYNRNYTIKKKRKITIKK